MNHDFCNRESYFAHMVKGVDFRRVNLQKLESMLDFNPFFDKTGLCFYLVLCEL